MTIDLALLRVIKYKEQFDKVHRYIPLSAIDKRTKLIVADFKKYFTANPDEEKLDFPAFRSMFFNAWHKKLSDSDVKFYNTLITKIEEDVAETIKKNIINNLLELEYATGVANVIQTYEQGDDIEVVEAVDNLTKHTKDMLERSTNIEFAQFEESTIGEEEEGGYAWPLECLNQHYKPIAGGKQFIIAARPGKGKTTLLTFLNYGMAAQMPAHKVIVWFNNESRKEVIMSRQIQTAIGKTDAELAQMKRDGTLTQAYIDAMGNTQRVRIYDIHGKNNAYLEDILESIGAENIGAIICDMLDNVKFPIRTDMREDQRLEQMYQWFRELGVKYNVPTFPTSQVSTEGEGLLFPAEGMLKDSKTGKQGACDGIIMLGSSVDPSMQFIRGLSMPKTKSKLAGMPNMREEVTFLEDIGRFRCN